MKLTLAFSLGACAIVPYILLKEAGADFQTLNVNLGKGQNHQADYLKINPKGKVPALIVDGRVITENVAIHVWIDRQFPQAGLMPSDPMQYIDCLSVLGWCGSGIHPKLTQQARPERYCDLPDSADRVKALGHEGMVEQYELAEKLLAGKNWFFNERFSCADAYFYWTFRRGDAFGGDLSRFKNCIAHRQRMEQRPSVQALLAHEEQVKAEFARAA
ncbi:MAG: glutathione S-transferase family protein [Alphaproteobacteria bacterium]|nr:glutathione S-transferase family protein [Alphaproteobacteria bacterium]